MKKQWYNVYMKCIKESAIVTTKLGEVTFIAKVKSEGLAYVTCKAVQESVGNNFKVYYK